MCIDTGPELVRADIVDLTVHGIGFMLDEALDVGMEISVGFPNRPEIRFYLIPAQVLRCSQETTDGKYLIAVKFLEVNAEYMNDVLALISNSDSEASSS